jgi:tetratricopeptide (TPR) repeat protein
MLHRPPPEGLGIRYDPFSTHTAAETLVLRRGNCVSLASVLVGLGRGLGWPIYYAEARSTEVEVLRQVDISSRADHMVVVIVAETVRAVVDFTGPMEGYRVHVIDDLRAYAHLVNNRAAEQIAEALDQEIPPPWEEALEGFALATRIHPEMARAWNNQGVALARLGRLEEARSAYARALSSDDGLGSTHQNLVVLETRARGEPTISDRAGPP